MLLFTCHEAWTQQVETYSHMYDNFMESPEFFKNMVVKDDTIYVITALGCNQQECMAVVKLDPEGNVIAKRLFPWMDEGDRDMIMMHGDSIVIAGAQSYAEGGGVNLLILNTTLDSLVHRVYPVPDSIIIKSAVKSVAMFDKYYIICGFGVTEDGHVDQYPGLLYWIDKHTLQLDSVISYDIGYTYTDFIQTFNKDSSLIAFMRYDVNNVFYMRGFFEFNTEKQLVWQWSSDYDASTHDVDNAIYLSNGYLIYKHHVENISPEFSLVCINPDGDEQWRYDSDQGPQGIKSIYFIKQAANGDIIGCGELFWKWADGGSNGETSFDGGYIFRMDSETGEMLWERAVIEYDSFGNFAGDAFIDIEELSDGSLVLSGSWIEFDSVGSAGFVGYKGWLVRTDSAGCVLPACSFESFTTSTNDIDIARERQSMFAIVPNPASGNIRLTSSEPYNPHDIYVAIYSMDGQQIIGRQSLGVSATLDTSGLLPGVYLVLITDGRGKRVESLRFVKM